MTKHHQLLNRMCRASYFCFSSLPKIIFTAATLSIVAACGPQASHVAVTDFSVRNIIEPIRLTHPVRFDENGTVNTDEKIKIANFLHFNSARYGDIVSLDTGFNENADALNIAVADVLASFGLTLSSANPVAGALPEINEAILVIDRFQVTPPNCHSTALNQALDKNTNHLQSTPGLGCSSQNLLGQMIANPRDLVRGSTFAGTNAQQSVRAATDYRLGRTSASPLPNSPVTGAASAPSVDGN